MKHKTMVVSIFLAAALAFSGCLGTTAGTGGNGGTPLPAISLPAQSQPPAPQTGGRLSVMLPSNRRELAALVTAVAAQDGLEVQVLIEAEGVGYSAAAARALEMEAPPDLVWLPDEAAFAAVGGVQSFADLSGGGMPAQLQALAAMVQPGGRLYAPAAVYGLPTGYYAQGTIVDLQLLAVLLNAENMDVLLADLTACSWQQWRMLAISIEEYLQRPGRIQITLGANDYFTPPQRPAEAQTLRGIFALPDADGAALMQSALAAAANLPFEGALDLLQATNEEKSERLYQPLGSLMGLLEFETQHMARSEGALHRGEAYTAFEKLSAEGAEALLCQGVALFMRGSSQTLLRLQRQYPQLYGRLCLLPVKLPLPAFSGAEQAAEPDTPASESRPPESGSEDAAPQPPPTIQQQTAQQNRRLWYASDGYVCMNKQTTNADAAALLLLRLFSSQEGQAGLAAMDLVPYVRFAAAATPLELQLDAAAAGEGLMLRQPPATLAAAEETLGSFVAAELLGVEEWAEEEIDAFFAKAFSALGLVYSLNPTLEEG